MTIQSPQQMLAGRYELRELIGRGGMAEVHLGYDTRLSRIVAIKLLRSDIAGDPTFQARFRREATSAAALNHPAIVAVYDSGEEELTQPDGTRRAVPFIVMEYVEGHTVRELLGEGEAVPISEAVEITTGVLDALEYSHRAGIVHRDIKPGNIMLTQAGAVKVMDFGIARAVEDSAATVTQTHAVVGTAQYLSPEQARGEVVDARSDLYSTGCLLYELLTGQPPFTGDSAVAIAYQHVREIPKPPSSIAADIPESLDRVVLKALAKNRDDRYQDAAHMRADLLAAARGLDVAAPATDSWAATTVLPQEAEAAAAAPSPQEQTPAEEEEQTRRRWWVWALVLVALIALGTLLGLYASGVLGRGPEPTPTPSATAVAVPSVSGMSESDAQSAIENLGLVYEKGDDVNSDTIDAGLAVSSDPGEGTSVLLGSTVTVHFSSGSAMVSVPDVSGQSQADARTAITNAGLSVGDVTTEDSTEVASGAVIRTDPVAGTSVERGSSVSLVVSSGKTTVPNVIGMTQDEAQSAITAAGLTYNSSTVEGTTDDESKDDQYIVTAVDPSEGNSVDANSSVTLTITHYTYKAPATATPEPTSDTVTPAAEPTTNDTAGDNG
ncbi:Stk1 family PASTA domain-containing Ser/Thr kinase [Actinomyces glycerinitolerans]|uniref:non-specific serine/threonine protein kinase n=1 Tax=Actinomyces glycerinitolerans TaxID=1892869 RepID=A0A1M4S359_9ACTO|nr:Stk1 family PASTA domain-containing Ser/Thr kinase [Actinomyces glycerinitolerans]SHE26645.1 serine/threonine-protein kinase active site [Actinomyces glycerinitolerans]